MGNLSKVARARAPRVYLSPDDPILWVDFYQLARFVDAMYIFFKPTMMRSAVTVTDVQQRHAAQQVTVDAKGARADDAHRARRIAWPHQLRAHRNAPLYILTDTLDPKLLIVTLCHSGNRAILEQKCLVVHCDAGSLWQKRYRLAERVAMRTRAHLLLEHYDWRRETFGDFVLSVNTTGTKTMTAPLPPGRQVMRLWVESPASYTVTIMSDADVELGPLEHVLDAMQAESSRLLQTCVAVGAAFGRMVQAFGSAAYVGAQQAFARSCLPEDGATVAARGRARLREDLNAALLRLVRERYADCGEILFCLRVLHLQPDLGRGACPPRKVAPPAKARQKPKVVRVQQPPQWDDDECLSDVSQAHSVEDALLAEKRRQWAACKVQAFFRMVYVRKLRAYHREDHPQFSKVYEVLKKYYRDFFGVDQRLEVVPMLLRQVLMRPPGDDVRDAMLGKYVWCEDIASVVNNQILLGSVPVPDPGAAGAAWVPIGRYVFFVDSPFAESVKISLFCNVERYVVRVFNNDSLEETLRTVSSASVTTYACNAHGYTVLLYGWARGKMTISYKLSLVTLKRAHRYPLCVHSPQTDALRLQDVYHHSASGLIARFQLGIANDAALTLRLGCSYEEVLLKLRCTTVAGQVVREVSGKEVVIMPVLQLAYAEAEGSTSQLGTGRRGGKGLGASKSSKRSKKLTLKKSAAHADGRSGAGSMTSQSGHLEGGTRADGRCYYLLEALVLKHSWPLTRDEWRESDKLIARNRVGASASTPSKVGLRKLGYDALPNPKWFLQMVHDPEEGIDLRVDRTRSAEIRSAKMKWSEGGPGRLAKGRKLREEYLREMSRLASDSLASETSFGDEGATSAPSSRATRTPLRPDGAAHAASRRPIDFSIYAYSSSMSGYTLFSQGTLLGEYSPANSSQAGAPPTAAAMGRCFEHMDTVADGTLKKPEDYAEDLERMERAARHFRAYYEDYTWQMADFRRRSVAKGCMLQEWFDGIREESAELMAHAYRQRAKFVEGLQGHSGMGEKKEKGGKGKKEVDESKDAKDAKRKREKESSKASKEAKKEKKKGGKGEKHGKDTTAKAAKKGKKKK